MPVSTNSQTADLILQLLQSQAKPVHKNVIVHLLGTAYQHPRSPSVVNNTLFALTDEGLIRRVRPGSYEVKK